MSGMTGGLDGRRCERRSTLPRLACVAKDDVGDVCGECECDEPGRLKADETAESVDEAHDWSFFSGVTVWPMPTLLLGEALIEKGVRGLAVDEAPLDDVYESAGDCWTPGGTSCCMTAREVPVRSRTRPDGTYADGSG